MSDRIGIGMIGYKFMGKAHTNAYRQVGPFFDPPVKPRLKVICGREQEKVDKMASRWGWETAVTDWRRVIDDPEVKIEDICSPTTRTTILHAPHFTRPKSSRAKSRSP